MIKKKEIKTLFIAIGIAIGIMLIINIAFYILLMSQTYNVFEETVGTRYEKNGVFYIDYNGATYTDIGNSHLHEYKLIPKTLGKVNDVFTLHNIEFDNNQDYLIVFTVREGYIYSKAINTIPESGEVTGIYIGNDNEIFITDKEIIKKLVSLNEMNGERYSYANKGSASFSTSLNFCYNGSLIAPNSFVDIAHIENGNWIYSNEFDSKTATRHGFIIKDPEVIKSLESLAGQVEAWDVNETP